ncbi:MAG: Uma2 family endonuclease [Polyangiaceae bacterium]|nr:Uma2 family endonuclease [Polyangiaceae bacterium]
MGRTAERSRLSAAEYLVWERDQPAKHEFFHGEVFAMAGGSPRHHALAVRVAEALGAATRSRGCEVFSSDQRIALGERYVYPDLSVVCGRIALQAGSTDNIVNPTILVEVLSSATEQYDRGLKWEGYQRLESLTDYMLVSQTEVRIEHFRREAGRLWHYRAYGPGERVGLTGGAELGLDDICAGVLDLPGEGDRA